MQRAHLIVMLGMLVLVGGLVALSRLGSAHEPHKPRTAPRPVGPELVVSLPWGSAGASLGRLDGDEAASEGPMSFAVDGGGALVVLDQVNARLARFDTSGALLGETPIPARSFQDLELAAGGRTVLLDRLSRRSLLVLDSLGQPVSEEGIEGRGVPTGGRVSAMMVDAEGVWLEVDHTDRVLLLDDQLAACARRVVRGRPFELDQSLLAAIDRRGGAELWVEDRMKGTVPLRATVPADHAISRIIWLETDRDGNVHGLFHLLEWDPADPGKLVFDQVLGARWDHSLQLVATYRSSHTITEHEQFREFRVLGDGTIVQMAFDGAAVSFLRWRWVP